MSAVAETARGRGKSGGKSRSTPALLACALLVTSAIHARAVGLDAMPTGGQVTAGVASISSTANTLTVQQSTDKAAINWQSFSVGRDATVNFVQPNASSVILNRVVGTEQSVIAGAMNANGQVFLLNSNGVLFTGTSSVNVGGLVASTLSLSDADFMAGRNGFSANGSRASVINLGTINAAEGGYVALLGNQVKNEGVITARLGTAILAAGDQVSLNFNSDSLVGVTIDRGTLDALVENKQAIHADGGLVILTAKGLDAVMATVVNNTGEVRAQTVANREGKIYLLGGMDNNRIEVGGTLDASAPSGGDGGFVETSAAKVDLRDGRHVTTAAAQGNTGTWLIDPNDYTIAATGGDITGTQLGIDLASNNIVITSVNGANASGNGDIFVNDAVTWSSNNALTLRAVRNININESITATGVSAKLALEYGQGAVSASNAANYRIASGKAVNLHAGQNFDTKLGSDGSNVNWMVINQLGNAGDESNANANNSLQGLGNSAKLAGNYVLGANIAASTTSTWNSGVGFTPIGDDTVAFTGRFDGLGHTIDGMTMDYSSAVTGLNVGLFGKVSGSRLTNINFTNTSIAGSRNLLDGNFVPITGTGTLAGRAVDTLISNVTVSGAASSNILNSRASFNLGGLVGLYTVDTPSASAGIFDVSVNAEIRAGISGQNNQVNRTGGIVGSSRNNTEFYSINNAYFNGTFVDTNGGMDDVGGIIGYATLTDILNSHVVVDFQNVGNYASRIGGLLGQNGFNTGQQAGNVRHSRIENSSVSGTVKGAERVGGLVGEAQYLDIIGSHSTATVTYQYDSDVFGGLAGQFGHGSITDSYATGNVTGGDEVVGGLVGELYDSTITRSYATGHVSTNDTDSTPNLGGLIGYAHSGVVITDSYATGNVMPKSGYASSEVGGLIGLLRAGSANPASITFSYATGQVGSQGNPFLDRVGGLIGYIQQPTDNVEISNSHYTGAGVFGRDKVGGLVGHINFQESGNIAMTDIHRSFSTGPVSGRDYVGGLLGQGYNVRIAESYSTGNVSGVNQVGGLIGEFGTGYTASTGNAVIGIDPAYTAIQSSSTNSYAIGNVTATGDRAGGFVGRLLYADLNNVYATGAVSAVLGATAAGGLVGTNVFDMPVGELYGYQNGGGSLVACSSIAANSCFYSYFQETGVTPATATNNVLHSFWDTQTSGMATSSGGQGKSTAEMRAFSTYLSTSPAWDILVDHALSGGYPKLRWATPGVAAGQHTWVIAPGAVNYTVAGGNLPYGAGFTLPTPSITGGSPTAAPVVKVYDSANNDVTTQAVAGTLDAGTYSVRVLLTDLNFQLSSSGNTEGVLTVASPAVSGPTEAVLAQAIANAITLPVINLPSSTVSGRDQPTAFVNVTNPLPSISAAFGPGEGFAVVSSPGANEPTQAVTLSQARTMMQSPGQNGGSASDGDRDVRVPASRNSLANIVNGGVKLPDGVEQQMFVVQAK